MRSAPALSSINEPDSEEEDDPYAEERRIGRDLQGVERARCAAAAAGAERRAEFRFAWAKRRPRAWMT